MVAGGGGLYGAQQTLLPPPPAHSASTPETWAKFTQENLQRTERERLASFNLRGAH